jgi:hypothetical protein
LTIHLPPQTCVLASPNAADGCAVCLFIRRHRHVCWLALLPSMGVLLNSLASMPRNHCCSFGLMPRVHCLSFGLMPRVHCHFQLASMPQVHCLSFGLMPRVHCHFQLASLPYLGYIAFPIRIPHCSYAFLAPHMPLWLPICLLAPHLHFGAPFAFWRPHLPFWLPIDCCFLPPRPLSHRADANRPSLLVAAFLCRGR